MKHITARRERKQVERIKSSSLRSVQRMQRAPATEDAVHTSPSRSAHKAEQPLLLLKAGSADAVRRPRGRPRKNPLPANTKHDRMMEVMQDDGVDEPPNEVAGGQAPVLSPGAEGVSTSERANEDAGGHEHWHEGDRDAVSAAEREGAADDEGSDETLKRKAGTRANKPSKCQKIMNSEATVGGRAIPGGGIGAPTEEVVARPYKMCEWGDVREEQIERTPHYNCYPGGDP